jgi:putative membrane protein
MAPVEPLSSNDLAALRTLMAADRTLMAWIRTSLSLLSFGFTIYKVLQGFVADEKIASMETPRNAGLVLAAAGTLAMIMGTVEYWQTLKELNQAKRFNATRPQLIMAFLMSAAGIALFVSIAAHVL